MSADDKKKEENEVGVIQPKNPHLSGMESDFFYHIGFSREHPLKELFGDVKWVIMGGSPSRMKKFALTIATHIDLKIPVGCDIVDLSTNPDRFSIYKAGPVLSCSHGMGMPSISILLHELAKMIHYSGCKDPSFVRIGTSGGIGCEPGSLVVTDKAVDGHFKPEFSNIILGKVVTRPAELDPALGEELMKNWKESTPILRGRTLSTHDFYEGQGRLDGAICEYDNDAKMEYLKAAHATGIRNIEMEALVFAAFCNKLDIKGAVVCVTLLNRLDGDQITSDHDLLNDYSARPIRLMCAVVKARLEL